MFCEGVARYAVRELPEIATVERSKLRRGQKSTSTSCRIVVARRSWRSIQFAQSQVQRSQRPLTGTSFRRAFIHRTLRSRRPLFVWRAKGTSSAERSAIGKTCCPRSNGLQRSGVEKSYYHLRVKIRARRSAPFESHRYTPAFDQDAFERKARKCGSRSVRRASLE